MTTTSNLFVSILLVLIFAGSGAAQTSKAAELTELLNEFLAGAGRNDVAIHEKFWGDDLIYTRSAGARINKAELMKGVRSAPPPNPDAPVTTYTAEDVQIHSYGSTAVVAFKLVGKTVKKDGETDVSEFLNTGTFVKRNGRWQAVAWQATAVPKTSAQAAVADAKPVEKPSKMAGRTYLKGPKGGCYYLSPSGKKTYVSKELCS